MASQEDVIKSLLFLDIFDYPPTAMEIWRFLPVRTELAEVVEIFPSFVIPTEARLARSGGIPFILHKGADVEERDPSAGLGMTTQDGCHFLPGRGELVERRREFFNLSEKKFKIAKRAARLLRFIPSVRMVAVCNNFYYRPESDVDFLIITSAKRLWLTRFFATIILDLFQMRARGKRTADKICLSFYIAEDHLNLEQIALSEKPDPSPASPKLQSTSAKPQRDGQGASSPEADKQDDKNIKNDPCLACWLAFMEPVYGLEVYQKFWQANDQPGSWFEKLFPNAEMKRPTPNRTVTDSFLSRLKKSIWGFMFFGGLGDGLEKICEKIQRRKFSQNVKNLAALDNTNVVLDERMLKFHENDDRENFRAKLRTKNEVLAKTLKSQI